MWINCILQNIIDFSIIDKISSSVKVPSAYSVTGLTILAHALKLVTCRRWLDLHYDDFCDYKC